MLMARSACRSGRFVDGMRSLVGRCRYRRLGAHQRLELVTLERLVHEELLCHSLEHGPLPREQRARAGVLCAEEAPYFGVNLTRRLLAEPRTDRSFRRGPPKWRRPSLREGDWAEGVAHAEPADHVAGELGRALEIVLGPGRKVAALD